MGRGSIGVLLRDCNGTHNHLICKRTLHHLAKLAKWLSYVVSTMHLAVCSYHIAYAFQSESILYSCVNVKKLLARNRRKICSLSDCNGTWTHKHLVCKRTLNHLAKLAKWLSSVLLWVLIRTVHLSVCFYHVTYAFQCKSILWMLRNSLLKTGGKSVPYRSPVAVT